MNPPFSVSLCYDYIVMVLHQFWYEYCIKVWLACDYVICHLHTSDNCLVVKIGISFECEAARGKQDRSGGEPSEYSWIRDT